ncbi:glycoside hydrolase family 3 domain protein [Klebsormidium nitens]|uniref:Glycoside hydrolase family 3 domain protein n=1 Tax=Klebsormidium nitens TaxID=105231 RepID=A0A1Y1IPT2_KLENI|nr:glycoside hydrolase family 3 domain protein [Klebsormidium nitens]|eukprot:GAQ91499.1 glycoside hydrolase family 3 domain protein [Klebsormidium nitens]
MDTSQEPPPDTAELQSRANTYIETPLETKPAPELDPEPSDVGTSEGAVESMGPDTRTLHETREPPSSNAPSEAPAIEPNKLAQEGRSQNLPSTEDLQSIAARLIVFGFTGKGPTLNKHAKNMIARGAGGVILFSRNFADPPQVAELAANLKREAGSRPLLVMVDQEGGRVQRLGPPFTVVPPARTIGAAGDPSTAEAAGRVLGKELRAVNVDMDLAPVMDVDTNPLNPVIGSRSFGTSPEVVSEMGYAVIRGLQQEGVAACAKHFPGHGDTEQDSHLSLPHVHHDRERLERVELPPFAAAISADVASILVAHVAVPALAAAPSEAALPASLSRGALHYLRHTLHFDGVIATDCLEMGAIAQSYGIAEAAAAGLAAGCDMFLVCHTEEKQVAAIEGIAAAVEAGHVPLKRLREAQWRIGQLASTYCRPAPSLSDPVETAYREALVGSVGSRAHKEAIAEIVKQAQERTQGEGGRTESGDDIAPEDDLVKQSGT